MTDFVKSDGAGASYDPQMNGLESRIQRTMLIVVGLAVVVSPLFASWRITTGLLLGGLLSVLNHRWIQSSIATAFAAAAQGSRPKIGVAKFVLRYFAVGFAVYTAYSLNLVSLPATILGLCVFVAALFVEAFRQFYFTFIRGEETR